jgi:thiamine-monophosphate kinase
MKVSELGQFGLIDAVAKLIADAKDSRAASWQQLITGIGDDCAVWRGDTANVLAKVDCQVQGVHFNLDLISWADLGWKSLAVNLSDIAAMGGQPRYALVSLGLPRDTEVENVLDLYRGMLKLAGQTGTAIVGGNMSGSAMIFVDVHVIGTTVNPEGTFLARSTARPGDLIAVTGWLGTAAAGFNMLNQKMKLDPATADCLRQAFARPEPRLAEGRLLLEKGVNTGMDISDGLVADLGHICQASQVGAVIKVDRLPVRPETRAAFGDLAADMALSGGEDYQLLFTAPGSVIEQVRRAANYPVTAIGEIIAENPGQVLLMDAKGQCSPSLKTGWDHFKSR